MRWCVAFIIVLGLAVGSDGAATFRLTNQEFPSLDSIATLQLEGWDPDISEPVPTTADFAYFVPNTTSSCTGAPTGTQPFSPSSVNGQVATFSSVPLVAELGLAEGNAYVMCYFSSQGFFRVEYSDRESFDVILHFTVLPPVFSSFNTIFPAGSARDGMGPVRASAVEAQVSPRQATKRSREGKLVPCSGTDCGNYTKSLIACQTATSTVALSPISGTNNVLLYVPFDGSTRVYHVCLPYDDSIDGDSWCVVRNRNVEFLTANPSVFTNDPISPRSRQNTLITLTAGGGQLLSPNDQLKIISPTALCGAVGNEVAGMQVGALAPSVAAANGTGTFTVTFTAVIALGQSVSGTICYSPTALSRHSSYADVWSPVYNSSARLPFVVLPTNPSSLALQTSSVVSRVAQPVTAEFSGILLSAADTAYFVEAAGVSCQSSDPDGMCSRSPQLPCTVEPGNNDSSVKCDLTYDSDATGKAVLCGCYNTTRSRNPILVPGSVSLEPRNPSQVSLSLDSLYGAQQAQLVFVGTGLETTDTIAFVPVGNACGPSTASNVSFAFATTSTLTGGRVERRYNVIAVARSCMTVCYFHSLSNLWVRSILARSTFTSQCPSTALYAAPYDVTFDMLPIAPNARQTFQVSYTPAVTTGFEDTQIKLVAVQSGCESTLGGSCPSTGPCTAANASGFSSGAVISRTGSVFLSSAHLGSAGLYMVCGLIGGAYAALRVTGSAIDAPVHSFTIGATNPSTVSVTPALRRNLGHVELTVTGTGLNASSDIALLFNKPALLGPSDDVCDFVGSVGSSVLGATVYAASSSTTSAVYEVTGTDDLTADVSTVAVCYYLGGTRPVFAGTFTVADSHPLSSSLTPAVGLAGLAPLQLDFPSGAQGGAALDAGEDTVFFFTGQVRCRCTRATCGSAVRVNSSEVLTGNTSSTSWINNFTGLPNVAVGAVYTVCYAAKYNDGGETAVTGSDFPPTTYLGTVTATAAHPTFFADVTARAGTRFAVNVRTSCSTCQPLADGDTMILQRVDGPHSACFQSEGTLESAVVENLTATTIAGGVATREFAVDDPTEFRVCYRLGSSTSGAFTQVANFSLVVAPLVVLPPDPSAFSVFPSEPTAGQMLTITLSCTGDCTCKNVRLVPGVRSSCWSTAASFNSGGTCSGDSVTFRGVDVTAGNYTVCYDDGAVSARVPGTLSVAAANPLVFDHALGADISTNQAGNVDLSISGSSLNATDDRMAVLPLGSQYHCHDLDSAFAASTELPWEASRDGWEPTIPGEQGDKVLTAAGLQWTLTTDQGAGLFFQDEIINNTFCSNPGLSCELQLCYRRSGTSWAQVPFAQSVNFTLVTANPVFVQFDRGTYRAGQYGLVNVLGNGLHSDDTFFIAFGGSCSGALVANISTPDPVVSTDLRNYTAPIRFRPTASAATRTTLCYRRGNVVNFIPSTSGISSVVNEYRYLSPQLNASMSGNYSSLPAYYYSQLEYARLFTVSTGSKVGLVVAASLSPLDEECPYGGFNPFSSNVRHFAVNSTDSSFDMVLDVRAGAFAICVERTLGRMYRIVADTMRQSETSFTVLPLTPQLYDTAPSAPFVDQVFTFHGTGPSAGTATGLLSSEDEAVVIDGSFEDCHNVDPVWPDQRVTPESQSLPAAFGNLTLDGSSGAVALNMSTSVAGQNKTVCYRRHRGSFFAVPTAPQYTAGLVEGILPPQSMYDRNLDVYAPLIIRWSTDVVEPSTRNPVTVTFTPNTSVLSTFQTSSQDAAMLVPAAGISHVPSAGDCDTDNAIAQTEALTLNADNSTAWGIAAAPAVGFYVVCYRVASQPNAGFRFVAEPGLLQIYPPASPYNVTTDVVAAPDDRTLYVREAVFLLLHTAEVLNISLVGDAQPEQDSVGFSERSDCADAATSAAERIPPSFNYADPSTPDRAALQVRFLRPGNFYVCVRRFNRTAGQRFFAFDSVGGPSEPVILTVLPFPIDLVDSTPYSRRAEYPSTVVNVLSSVLLADTNARFFFVENQGLAGETVDNLGADECYHPNATQVDATGLPLRDRSLEWSRVSDNATAIQLRSVLGFNTGGSFTLCFQLENRRISSYFPPLVVADTVPIHYQVPPQLAPGASFVIEFYSNDTDQVLAEDGNRFVVRNASVTLNCDGDLADTAPLADGTSIVGNFLERNATRATANLRINLPGTFLVCFSPFDQVPGPLMKRTRRDTGSFFFTIGDTGPSNFSVSPVPPRQGQTITVTVDGQQLSGGDRAKVIDVTTVADQDLVSACNASVASLNAATNDAAGDAVTLINSNRISFTARVNTTTKRAAVCYFGANVGWSWVTSPATFEVFDPQPSSCSADPVSDVDAPRRVVYQNEVFNLTLFSTVLTPDQPELAASDELKLVNAADSTTDGFHCSQSSAASGALTVPSDDAAAVYTLNGLVTVAGRSALTTPLCATQAAPFVAVVCYRQASATWAEVPSRLPGPGAAEFDRLTYVGPVASSLEMNPADPTVNEPFVVSFLDVWAGDQITALFLTQDTVQHCNETFTQTFAAEIPVSTESNVDGRPNRFRLAVGRQGTFAILVQTQASGGKNITTALSVTVLPCNPCSATPTWAFEGSSPALQVNSPVGGLDQGDVLKLVSPSAANAQPAACDGSPAWATTDAPANHTPTATNSLVTAFAVPVPAVAAVSGVVDTYALCYRRAGRTSFAQLPSTPTFDVRPYQPSATVQCPTVVFGGQRVQVNFSSPSGIAAVEQLSHSNDALLAVRSGRPCASSETIMTQAFTVGPDPSSDVEWWVDVPDIADAAAEFGGSIDLCYRHRNDAAGFRRIGSIAVRASDPFGLPSQPSEPTVGMRSVSMWATGTFLDDVSHDVYLVDNASSCREVCGSTTTPANASFNYHISRNATVVMATLPEPASTPQAVKLCYRRGPGSVLAEVPGSVLIGPLNPHTVTSNVTLFSESAVFLTFHGDGSFNSGDTATLADTSEDCSDPAATQLVTGSFLFANSTSSTFLFDLAGVPAGTVQACYTRQFQHPTKVHDVSLVPLPWLTWTTSNVPMEHRFTTVSFPEYDPVANATIYGVGDEAKVVHGAPDTQNCHQGAAVCDTCTSSVQNAAVDRNAMRVLLPARDYRVCFRLTGSGWFEVPPVPLRVISAVPTSFSMVPDVHHVYQGQRINVVFTTPLVASADHKAVLVTAARGCGPDPAISPAGIVQTVDVSASQEARFHLPSIGTGNDTHSFPLAVLVCFLEAAQPELLAAAHSNVGRSAIAVAPASPVIASTQPSSPRLGHINVSFAFGAIDRPSDRDEAYVVHVDAASDAFNRSCDAPGRVTLSRDPVDADDPVFSATVLADSQTTVIFCYRRENGTVAEVAALELGARSPLDFEVIGRAASKYEVRRRQYASYALNGSALTSAGAEVIFTERDCVSGIPDGSSHVHSRMSDVTGGGDTLFFTAQVLRVASAPIRVCVRESAMWSELPRRLSTVEATPTSMSVISPSGLSRMARRVDLNFTAQTTAAMISSISPFVDMAYAVGFPGWCNASTAAVVEAPLQVVGSGGVDANAATNFWGTPHTDASLEAVYTLCTREEAAQGEPLADVAVADEFTVSALTLLPAHPGSMATFSRIPRVGQEITVTFTAAPGRIFAAGDSVKLVSFNTENPSDPANACHNASAVSPHDYATGLVARSTDGKTAQVTFREAPEPYESFAAAANFTVCFWDAAENQWAFAGGAVGGITASQLEVKPRAPDSWAITAGQPFLRNRFNLSVYDSSGASAVLNAATDVVVLVPVALTCGSSNPGVSCPGCVNVAVDRETSNSTHTTAFDAAVPIVGSYRVCYRLENSTAAMAGPLLLVTAGYVECVLSPSKPTVGRKSELYFRLRDGTVDTSADGFLITDAVSGIDFSVDPCDTTVPTFTYAMARHTQSFLSATPPNSSFELEWPVMADNASHTVCFRHRGITAPVCSCDQVDSGSLDCFIAVEPADPVAFDAAPRPTYVGQDVTVTIANTGAGLESGFIAQVPSTFPAAFRTCYGITSGDLDGSPSWLRARFNSSTVTPTARPDSFAGAATASSFFNVSYKHDYTLGPESLMVCMRTGATDGLFARLPVVRDFAAVASVGEHDAIVHRPYVSITTFPTAASDLLRANQTIDVTITHTAQHPANDDVLSLDRDELVLVVSPSDCSEASAVASSVPVVSMGNETGPAFRPRSETAASTTVRVISAISGNITVCYRLGHGTWAPVVPPLGLGAALYGQCSAPHEILGSGEAVVRARQYLPVEAVGVSLPDALTRINPGISTMRLVRRGSHCEDDDAAVSTSNGIETDSSSSVVRGMLRAAVAGEYDVCLRVHADQSLFSPLCVAEFYRFTSPFPAAVSTSRTLRRCFAAGFSMNWTFTAPTVDGRAWDGSTDAMRFVHSADECDALDSVAAKNTSADVVANGRVPTSAAGVVVASKLAVISPLAASIAPVAVRAATSLRVCFRDVRGTWSDVPVTAPTVTANGSSVSFTAQVPTLVSTSPSQPTSAQRIIVNISEGTLTVPPQLLPLTPRVAVETVDPPSHFEQPSIEASAFAPTVNVYFTGALYQGVGACHQHAFESAYAVSADTSPTNDVTTIAFPEGLAGRPAVCYFVVGCGWMDVVPVTLREPNPSRATPAPGTPRRGQLITYDFDPNRNDTSGQHLTSGVDRAVFTKRASCFANLIANDDEALQVVPSEAVSNGTAIVVIAYAEAPAVAAPVTVFRVCYFISDGAWASVPQGVSNVLAANPTHFETFPPEPTTHTRITLTFRGAGLSNRDKAKVIPLALNCSDDSTPDDNMTSLAANTFQHVEGTTTGWDVLYAPQDPMSTTLNVTTTVPGRYSVCYKLESDTVWTLVYADLSIEPRNPANYTMVPAGALEGELFTLSFFRRSEAMYPVSASNEMGTTDAVQLIFGTHANCYAASLRGILIQTEPSDSRKLVQQQDFQLAAGTRGLHTLCYLLRDPARDNVAVWGYGSVRIGPNPERLEPAPASPSRNQLVKLVFYGHGLLDGSSESGESDEIKFTAPGEDCRQVNESAATSASLRRISFTTDGTTSTLQVVSDAPGPFQVCYKLFGGVFHALSELVSFRDPNPVLASASKAIGTAGALKDNEQVRLTIAYAAGRSGWHAGDYVSFAAFPDGTPAGSPCFNSTLLAEGPALSLMLNASTGLMETTARFPRAGTFDLCYVSPIGGSGSVSVLSAPVVVGQGASVSLQSSGSSLQSSAGRVLNYVFEAGGAALTAPSSATLNAQSAIAIVANETDCVGSPPASDARGLLAEGVWSDNLDENSTLVSRTFNVTLVLGSASRTIICHVQHDSDCTTECARVLGVIAVEAPASISVGSTVAYTFERVPVSFTLPSPVAAATASRLAWVGEITETGRGDSIDRINACRSTSVEEASQVQQRVTLTSAPPAVATASGQFTVPRAARFAFCIALADASTWPFVFTGTELVARESLVADLTFDDPTNANVASAFRGTVSGRGLNTQDSVFLRLAQGSSREEESAGTAPGANCSTPAVSSDVTGTTVSSSPQSGQSATRWSFAAGLAGYYTACYQIQGQATPTAIGTVVVGSVASRMLVVDPYLATNTPFRVSFTGLSLSTEDEVAFALHPDLCSNGSTVTTFEDMATIANDGRLTTSRPTTILQAERYYACYRPRHGRLVAFSNPPLEVNSRRAVGVRFVETPVCTAWTVCEVQPRVVLVDASGNVASDPTSRLEALFIATVVVNGNSVSNESLSEDAYSGLETHAISNSSTFAFFAVRFNIAGQFRLGVRVALSGDQQFASRSEQFTVQPNPTVRFVDVACTPPDMRWEVASAQSICTVRRLSSDAADDLTVAAFAIGTSAQLGTAVRNSTDGTTDVWILNVPSDAFVANAVNVTVRPELGSVFRNSLAQQDWTIVRLVTYPGSNTAFSCAPAEVLPEQTSAGPLVRQGANVTCALQPRYPGNVVDVSQTSAVASYGTDFELGVYTMESRESARKQSTAATVAERPQLPRLADDINGATGFTFSAPRSPAWLEARAGAYARDSVTPTPLLSSPYAARVVGEPDLASTISCVPTGTNASFTGGVALFVPATESTCTFVAMDQQGSVLTLRSDIELSFGSSTPVTTGALTDPDGAAVVGNVLSYDLVVPSASRDTAGDETFTVVATRRANGVVIATFGGSLLYIRAASEPEYIPGSRTTVRISGSGLRFANFSISRREDCSVPIDVNSIADPGTTDVTLDFVAPEYAFFVCYRFDESESFRLLSSRAYNNGTRVGDVERIDNLVLLLVGLGLLALLIALALCLLCGVMLADDAPLFYPAAVHPGSIGAPAASKGVTGDTGRDSPDGLVTAVSDGIDTSAEEDEEEEDEFSDPGDVEPVPEPAPAPEAEKKKEKQSKKEKKERKNAAPEATPVTNVQQWLTHGDAATPQEAALQPTAAPVQPTQRQTPPPLPDQRPAFVPDTARVVLQPSRGFSDPASAAFASQGVPPPQRNGRGRRMMTLAAHSSGPSLNPPQHGSADAA